MQQFEGQVQLVLYPIAFRPPGEIATQAVLCAGEQGKFWAFHDMVFRRQAVWSHLATPLERLSDFAKELGIDTTALKSCVESGRMQSLIKADIEYATQLQVNSTPTLFINTHRLVGAQTEGEIVRLIRQELERVQGAGK